MGSASKARKGTGKVVEADEGEVPFVWSKVEGIACSDLHLCHKPPVARSAEPDWYAAMQRPIDQLRKLQAKAQGCPILIAGDLTDKFDQPPELINFMMEVLPDYIFAIPGQHDLPNHNLADIKRSAYWTLVRADKIHNLGGHSNDGYHKVEQLWVAPFPWGADVTPLPKPRHDKLTSVALIHSYIWQKGSSYHGAPEEKKAKNWLKRAAGYDLVVYGDNHKGFQFHQLFNCGAFIRRKADEYNYRPQVGLIMENGTIIPHYLDTSEDKFIDIETALSLVERAVDASDLLLEIAKAGDLTIDFVQAVKEFCDKNGISRRIILAIENAMRSRT